jgi:hypothetical protein
MRSKVDLFTAGMAVQPRQIRLHTKDVGSFESKQRTLLKTLEVGPSS